MIIKDNMCLSKLVLMMAQFEQMHRAIHSFQLLSIANPEQEGIAGFMEVKVEFEIKNLEEFVKWGKIAHTANSPHIYHAIRNSNLEILRLCR